MCAKNFSPKKGVSYRQWNKSFWCSRECFNSSRIGTKCSYEHRMRISQSNKGRIVSQETKNKIAISNTGKVRSQEVRSKLSKMRTGVPSPIKGVKKPHKSGIYHWNWIVDRSKVKVGDRCQHDPLYKQWCKGVKDRDKWTCRIADVNCDGRLEAHHILPWSKFPELRYQVNNGIALCHFHHPRKRVDEEKLSPYFQQLVASLE